MSAVYDQRRAEQAQREAVDGAGQVGARHLFGDDGLLHWSSVLATVFVRPAHTDEARLIQPALPRFLLLERIQRPRRMLRNPATHVQTKAFVFSRIIQVHSDLLSALFQDIVSGRTTGSSAPQPRVQNVA